MNLLKKFSLRSDDTVALITSQVEKSKDVPDKDCWWPTDSARSRFMRKYNLRYKNRNVTTYSWSSLKDALTPSLIMSSAIRHVFGIKGGEGKSFNADESLTYRWVQKSKTWTV